MQAKFDVAQTTAENRKHWASADALASRAALSPAVRKVVRIRSRYEAENNSWYCGILRTAVNHIVGNGPRLQVLTDNPEANSRLEKAWRQWAAKVDLADMIRTMVEAYWRDGEVFVMRAERPRNWPLSLDLRTFEADQVSNPWDAPYRDPYVEDGIRFDPSTNELEVYVYDHHPGSNTPLTTLSGQWYSSNEVLHLFRAERPGQIRGIPRVTPALQTLPIMRRQELATLYSAETAANFAMYLKSNSLALDPAASPADFAEIELTRNMLTTLPAGWEIGQVEPKQPGPHYEMFQRQALQSFCRCTNMPYTLAAGTGKDANFSSFKGDMKNVWEPEVQGEQSRIEWHIIEPVFRWFLDSAIYVPGLLDGLPSIGEIDHRWHWPPLPELDAIDSANAAAIRLSTGQSTPTEEHARRGKDWATESIRAAADFGVSPEEYRRAVFLKTFATSGSAGEPQSVQPQPVTALPQGEYTQLGQRAFSNNQKRIKSALDQLTAGDISQVMAEQTLASIGLSQDRIDALIADALDGGVADETVQDVNAQLGDLLEAAVDTKTNLTLTADLDLKSESGKPRRFQILAYSGGKLPVAGFDSPVVVDLSGLEVPGSIPILIDHQKSVEATLGLTDSIENDGRQLTLAGPITGVSQTAQQVLAQAAAGHTWQASIGAMVIDAEDIAAGETVAVNGQTFVGPVIVARRSMLRETSVLPMGADATTQVNLAAAAATTLKGSAMSFDEWLTSLGLDASTMSAEDIAAMQLAYDAKQKPPEANAMANEKPPEMPTANAQVKLDLQAALKEGRQLLAAEVRKSAEIQAKAAGFPQIQATAIEQGWSIEKVELEVLKAQNARTRPTSFRSAENEVPAPQVLEAALCVARKQRNAEKQFDDKTLQAAHTQYRGQVGLQQVFLLAAAASGLPVNVGDRLSRSLMSDILHAMNQQHNRREFQAAFSVATLPGLLSNVANKELLMGFEDEDTSWQEVSDIKSVSDFKTVTSYRMLDNMEYEELGPGGSIKHGTLGDETFTRSVKTYAKMFALTYQMVVDDDLGAFDDVRNRLGRGSSRRLKRLVWTTFLANPTTFWTTARTNYIEGGTTNLGADGVGLSLGVKAFRQRKSPVITGEEESSRLTLGGRPTKLVVPPELEAVADQLYTARNITAVKVSDANIHANKYRPIVVNELSDSAYGGGHSATAWYLLGENDKPIVTSFLNGQQSPTVESADADFSVLGVQFRGYHDFGCDQSEYMAGIKSKGAA
jgi:capsid protein